MTNTEHHTMMNIRDKREGLEEVGGHSRVIGLTINHI